MDISVTHSYIQRVFTMHFKLKFSSSVGENKLENETYLNTFPKLLCSSGKIKLQLN